MSASREDPPAPRMRRSAKVALVLLGAAGVVGVATAWDAWRRARERDNAVAGPAPAPLPVSGDRTYANNEYIPGAGYYHAPFYGWFPFPWNFHNPGRGYFAGGQWLAAPMAAGLMSSRPSQQAVAAAAAAQRARLATEQSRARTSGFSSAATNRGSSFTSRSPSAPSSKPSTTRSGFGSSSRGSSS